MPSHIFAKSKMRGCLTKKVCPCCSVLQNTKRMFINSDEFAKQEIENGISDIYPLDCDVSNDPYLKSLYPNANKIECYHHYIFGYDVLVVDGIHQGEYNDINELLAFAYHCGISYIDRNDLENKYQEFLSEYERWSFLP